MHDCCLYLFCKLEFHEIELRVRLVHFARVWGEREELRWSIKGRSIGVTEVYHSYIMDCISTSMVYVAV